MFSFIILHNSEVLLYTLCVPITRRLVLRALEAGECLCAFIQFQISAENFYYGILWYWGQRVSCPRWYTDYFAFHALAILKHLKSTHFSTKNGYFSASYYLRAENRRNRFSALLYYLPVSRFIPKSFSTEISTPFFLSFSLWSPEAVPSKYLLLLQFYLNKKTAVP